MLSKRKEHFRYSFGTPIWAAFYINKINENNKEEPFKSSVGEVRILDISPSGLKIETIYDIPCDKSFLLEFTFSINEEDITVLGHVLWQQKTSSQYIYGVKLNVDSDLRQHIINELKEYSKKLHIKGV